MSTLTIYYFTLLGCIYWMLLTIHSAIKLNEYNSFWFLGFIIFHFFFFIYWHFSALGWKENKTNTEENDNNDYSFNPFNGKIKVFNHSSLSYRELNDSKRDNLIDTNIPISCNLLILFNIVFGLMYSMLCLLAPHKHYFI